MGYHAEYIDGFPNFCGIEVAEGFVVLDREDERFARSEAGGRSTSPRAPLR
jgi:hypothetical protein